mmetsp:Transcript_33617/g.46000  ORF Transcript_33617/g.46000 Transcript_33617/m.46000 type:complete len:421 (+) Transcript_33617:126-1388(+)
MFTTSHSSIPSSLSLKSGTNRHLFSSPSDGLPSRKPKKGMKIHQLGNAHQIRSCLDKLEGSSLFFGALSEIATPLVPPLAKHLYRCYEGFGKHHSLLRQLWSFQVSLATSEEDLFLRDTLCAELLQIYQFKIGHGYLHALIGTFLQIQEQCRQSQSPTLKDDFGEFVFLFEGSIPELPNDLVTLYSFLFRLIKEKFGFFAMKKFVGIHFVKNFLCHCLKRSEKDLQMKVSEETKKIAFFVSTLFQCLAIADKKLPKFFPNQKASDFFTSQNHKSVNRLLQKFRFFASLSPELAERTSAHSSQKTETELCYLTIWEEYHVECRCSGLDDPQEIIAKETSDVIQNPDSFCFLGDFLAQNRNEFQEIVHVTSPGKQQDKKRNEEEWKMIMENRDIEDLIAECQKIPKKQSKKTKLFPLHSPVK